MDGRAVCGSGPGSLDIVRALADFGNSRRLSCGSVLAPRDNSASLRFSIGCRLRIVWERRSASSLLVPGPARPGASVSRRQTLSGVERISVETRHSMRKVLADFVARIGCHSLVLALEPAAHRFSRT